jgi:hypothetical protein
MIAFVTALESSMRRLRKLLSYKTKTDPKLLRISIEMTPSTDQWALLVRRAGTTDIIVENQGPDMVSLVHNTLCQVERELAERRGHCLAEIEAINALLRADSDA